MTLRRWSDPQGDAPDGARALLDAARKTRLMTAAERERSAKRVARLAAAPVTVGLLASLKGLAVAAGIGAGSGLVLIGAITIVEAHLESAPETRPSMHDVPLPPDDTAAPAMHSAPPHGERPTEEPTLLAPSGLAPAPRSTGREATTPELPAGERHDAQPPTRDTSAPPAPSPAGTSAPTGRDSSSETDALLREVQLLDQARGFLAPSPAEALSRLDEHARQFPRGKLGLEREFLLIDALRRLGRGAEASARGEALLSRSTGTPYEKRVRERLGISP